MRINGFYYKLNQCDGDLLEWIANAKVGEFTHYYDKLVYVTFKGVFACYADCHENSWEV